MAKDPSNQLAIEQQINAAIQQRAALMERNKAGLADQIALAQELCRALECKELDGYQERMNELKSGLLEAADSSEELTDRTQEFEKASKKAAKSSFSMKAAAVGAFVAMKNAASGAVKVMTSIPGMVTGAIGGAFNILKMGMNAYNTMIDGLLQKSIELRNGSNAMRQAMEEVREEFGALHKGEGAAIIGTFENMGSTMKGTGTNLNKYFGSGSEGRAERLKMFQEVASGMGPVFTRLAGDFEAAGQEIMIAQKALGMTGEGMAALALTGRKHGKTMKEVLQGVQKQVVQVSKAYGVNEKLTGKMLDQMAQAPEIFGTDTKEMLKMSVAAQKLGVSVETLGKTTKVFDDFESGAKAASELASQFGITVDAMDMMTATPAEQVTMLKDAMQASGQEFENMSRQEKARMAELTRMDMSELQNLMDPTNAFDMDAMDDVDKGVDQATKATMQQTEATRALEKAIKRVTEAGQAMSAKGGFLGTFIDGMMTGIANSKEFKHILNNIYDTFKIVYDAGRKVGDKLAELMNPGGPLNFILVWFDEMFNPEKMQEKMNNIVGFFSDFVNTVMDGGDGAAGAFTTLFNNIVDELLGGSGGSGEFFQKMLDGLAYFFDWVAASLIRFLPTVLEGLTNLFKMGIDLMTNGLPEMGTDLATDGLFPMINSAVNDPKLKDAWDGLVKTFLKFIDVFWTEYGDEISTALGAVIAAIIGASLLQALPIVLASGAIGGLIKGLSGAIGSKLGMLGGGEGSPTEVPSRDFGDKMADAAKSIKQVAETLAEMKASTIAKAGAIMLLLAGTFALALYGFIEMAAYVQKIGLEMKTMLAFAALVYAAGEAMSSLGYVVSTLSYVKVGPKEIGVAVLLMGLLVGVVWALTEIIVNAVEAFGKISKVPDEKVVEAAGGITLVIMTAVAGVVAMSAVLAGIALLISNPLTAGIIAAALVASIAIFWAMSELMIELVEAFGKVSIPVSQKAGLAAEAAGMLVATLMETIDLLQQVIDGMTINEFSFAQAAAQMSSVVATIAEEMMPAMKRAADTITEDPQIIRDKLGIIIDLMHSFSPIAELMTAALQIQDLSPEEVAAVVKHVTGGIEKVMSSMSGLVNDIIKGVGGLSDREIKTAEAAAPLLTAVAGLMNSFKMPAELLSDEVQRFERTHSEPGMLYGTNTTTSTHTKRVKAQQRQRAYIDNFVYMLKNIKKPLQDLVSAMLSIDTGDADLDEMEKKMQLMISAFGAVGAFGDALSSLGDLDWTEARDKSEQIAMMFGSYKDIAIDYLLDAIEGMGEFVTKVQEQGIKMDVIETINNWYKAISPLMGTLKYMPDGEKAAQGAAKLFQGFQEYRWSFTDQARDDLIHGLNMLAAVSQTGSKINNAGFESIRKMMSEMIEMEDDVRQFGWQISASMWEPLLEVLSAFNEMGLEMGAAGNIVDIESKLKAIGQALKVSGDSVTVERGDVTITVNLNVGLEAKTLSQVLVYNGLVTKGVNYVGPFNDANK